MPQPSPGRMVHVIQPTPGHHNDQTVCRPGVVIELAHPDREDGSEQDIIVKIFTPAGDKVLTASRDEVEMKTGSWHWPEIV